MVPLRGAVSPDEDRSSVLVRVLLPWANEGEIGYAARAKISVMQAGELYVHEPEVPGWQVDSNGDWINR